MSMRKSLNTVVILVKSVYFGLDAGMQERPGYDTSYLLYWTLTWLNCDSVQRWKLSAVWHCPDPETLGQVKVLMHTYTKCCGCCIWAMLKLAIEYFSGIWIRPKWVCFVNWELSSAGKQHEYTKISIDAT